MASAPERWWGLFCATPDRAKRWQIGSFRRRVPMAPLLGSGLPNNFRKGWVVPGDGIEPSRPVRDPGF